MITEPLIVDKMEKRMVNPQPTQFAPNPYFAGYVDGLYDMGIIDSELRARLFLCYADPELGLRLKNKLED